MKRTINALKPIMCISAFVMGVLLLIYYIAGSSVEYMLSDNAVFYSIDDIENDYSNTGKYKEYMIADNDPDIFIFSTIEDYTEAKVGIGNECIVSGIFIENDRSVYEIAVFENGIHSDPTYYLLDTKYTVLYDMNTLVPVVEGEDMIKELNSIEKQYEELQDKKMVKYEGEKILKYDYVKLMIEKLAKSEDIKYDDYKNMGIVIKDDVLYYQVDFCYKDENSIYLVNANTCDMIKVK